jgi:hypothetical protein
MGLGALLVAVLILGWSQGWLSGGSSSPGRGRDADGTIIDKQPVVFAQHAFDPKLPPADMPPLGEGEEAECDSDFLSNANVSGKVKKLDASSAVVTVTRVKITLQLKINIWVPAGAMARVIEHEHGHRQISEAYYQTGDKVAEGIAEAYIGKRVFVSGGDLETECNKALQHLGAAITAEYNDQLSPNPAQQRYDDLTDHSRNGFAVEDAVLQALKETQGSR